MTNRAPAVLIALIILCVFTMAANAEHVIDDSKNLRYQFVLSGDTGTVEDGKITLNGVPIVTFNSLGAKRGDGHFFVKSFVDMWNNNAQMLEKDPPNGTLSVLSDKGSSGAVVELSEPSANLNSITFKVRILEGALPEEFGSYTLFLKLTLNEYLKTQE
jgi:hypothetical protein